MHEYNCVKYERTSGGHAGRILQQYNVTAINAVEAVELFAAIQGASVTATPDNDGAQAETETAFYFADNPIQPEVYE